MGITEEKGYVFLSQAVGNNPNSIDEFPLKFNNAEITLSRGNLGNFYGLQMEVIQMC